MARISYLELPSKDVAGTCDFYAKAFGWGFTDFGPDYAATTTGDTDLGINGSTDQAIALLLPVIEVQDLEAAFESVQASGGEITVPIFAFPGGRRFHFRDPEGNELGVFVNEPE
ncbi:VOC family protein [Sphingomonas sp. KR3-1]|uniref:VOC family protein n=1 Tax=Sphingomonas sp. KR3-1 TaxID=3156611 RepID=UPI0032B451FF